MCVMKKILVGLLTTLGYISSAQAVMDQILYWPGYVDNSDCLSNKAGTDCGLGVNIFKNDGKFYESTRSHMADRLRVAWGAGGTAYDTQTVKVKLLINISLSGWAIDRARPYDPGFGLPLLDANGRGTNYRLKGLNPKTSGGMSEGLTMRLHWCTWDSSNKTCDAWHGEGAHTDVKLTEQELYNRASKQLELKTSKQGIRLIEMWMNGSNWRLVTDNPSADSRVRSLYLPGISYQTVVEPYNRAGNRIKLDNPSSGTVVAFSSRQAMLNQRKCELKVKPSSVVDFKEHSVSSTQIGIIGDVIPTELYLSCGQTTQMWLPTGGKGNPTTGEAPPWKSQDVNGFYAVHTVESVTVTPTLDIGGNGIGLKRAEDKVASNVIYVEGSLSNTPICGGSDTLPLKVNLKKDFPNEFQRVDKLDWNKPEQDPKPHEIRDRHMKTLYWRLCKKHGSVDAGLYEGAATVTIQYK